MNIIDKKFIIAFILVMFLFLIVGIYFHHKDKLYEECIEDLAYETCSRHDMTMASFSAWMPHVKCIEVQYEPNHFDIQTIYNNEEHIYIFNESQINKCWNQT